MSCFKRWITFLIIIVFTISPYTGSSVLANSKTSDEDVIRAIASDSGMTFSKSAKLTVKKLKHRDIRDNTVIEKSILAIEDLSENGIIRQTLVVPYQVQENSNEMSINTTNHDKRSLVSEYMDRVKANSSIGAAATGEICNPPYSFNGVNFYLSLYYAKTYISGWGDPLYQPSNIYAVVSGGTMNMASLRVWVNLAGHVYRPPSKTIVYKDYIYSRGINKTNVPMGQQNTYNCTDYPSGCYTYVGAGGMLGSMFIFCWKGTYNGQNFESFYTIDEQD